MKFFDPLWAKLLAGLLMAFLLVGCTTFKNVFNNVDERAARVVVTVAVMDVVNKNPEYKGRILEITKQTREYVSKAPEGRATDIMDVVNKQIRWEKLTAEQSLLVNVILVSVEVELHKRIADGGLSPDAQLKVIQIIDWIEQAAST
jgi:hypothetical protein